MGTPDLAAVVFDRVLAWEGGRIVAAYCQPDRPAGRGMATKAPPVKELAQIHGIPVFQPAHFKNDDEVAVLRSLRPEYLLVAAYGLILPRRVLDIPTRMPLNVHTSLLPRYRGAAPIQRAVMDGETETGVTIMKMEAGLDTGPVIVQKAVPIGPDDTAGDMHDALALEGGNLLVEALEGLERKKMTLTPQDEANASYAAKLGKADGRLDFSRTGAEIHARRRGVTPWPGAFGVLAWENGETLEVKILEGTPLPSPLPPLSEEAANLPVGSVLPGLAAGEPGPDAPGHNALGPNALGVVCADGIYCITQLRPANRKLMDAAAFMNGYCKDRGRARFLLPPE